MNLEEIVKYEIDQLRKGARFTSEDIRIFARVDGFDIDWARKQTITNVIDKYCTREKKLSDRDVTVWRNLR